jgi:ABC-type oligopeptide transport system substrate-binding subunit
MSLSRRRVVAAAAVVASAALALTALRGGSSSSESTSVHPASGAPLSGTVTVYNVEPQNPLIPTNTNETGGGNVVNGLWTGLVDYKVEDGAQWPWPSRSRAPLTTTWTIKIKPG